MADSNNIWFLIQHAIRVEFRKKHGIAGLLVFAIASVYTCYQATEGHAESESWNALTWVVLLFTAFNAVSKPWADDAAEIQSFLLHTVPPTHWLIARIAYYSLMICTLSAVVFGAFLLFLGAKPFASGEPLVYFIGVECTALALASLLAMIQALAVRAGGGFNLVAVLGLPLLVPVILVSTRYGTDIMRGVSFMDTSHHLLFLASLTGGFIALGYILFPYLWRD